MDNEKKQVNYSIGLDIGTSSVGWAVVDENSELLKKGKNHLWGFDIFEGANTAADRRVQRGTRRRYLRRIQRIKLLQDFCTAMIESVDPLFFKRMENSYLVPEDREGYLDTENILFVDGTMTDKEFYDEYPTIYHLRHALMNSDEKADPRLVYLALHHIVKYRGNFLYEGQSFDDLMQEEDIKNRLVNVFECLSEAYGWALTDVDINEYLALISSEELRGKDRVKAAKKMLSGNDGKVLGEITNLILGYVADVALIFNKEFEENKDGKVKFSDSEIEDKMQKLEGLLEDDFDLLVDIQSVYSFYVLQDILKDSTDQTISSSMMELYKKHQNDLKLLKEALKDDSKAKKAILKEGGSYDIYINNPKKKSQEDLISDIKDALEGNNTEAAKKILSEEDEDFLPKQRTSKNGAIPYQLHENELVAIIEKQGKYYPCLKENADKLRQLVNFRIPYYVGPLNKEATNAWLIRKDENDHEPIRPWNIEEKVDIDKTAEEFIRRMTNHCTYLLAEDAMAKNSITYGRFNLYNELNKVRVDGHLIFKNGTLKERVIEELFLKYNSVSEKKLIDWLFDNQEINTKDVEVKGLQGDGKFNSSFKVERDFRKIFGDEYESHFEDIEKIIEYLSIYNDKKIIERRLNKEMPYLKEKGWLKKISSKQYSGFGNLSYKLLNVLLSDNRGGNPMTILEIMENTTLNFMQIINEPKYGFADIIAEENEEYVNEHKLSYRTQINELAGSPALKRGILQSIRVVEDIVKYEKCEPKEIFIEFAREEGEKNRTTSRKKQLLKLINKKSPIYEELEKLSDNQLQNERYYLYCIQEGKCLYSGKELDINKISSYQVDHILPQCYVKDDSIENKALVLAEENQRKSGDMLLKQDIIFRQRPIWESLKKRNLMGEKKFHNLTRTSISEGEKVGFIARQLVETRQISVHVKNILKSMYKDTDVLTVHAPLSSEFRKKQELFKIRALNNTHHAQDAYLACLIGQFINHKYPFLIQGGKIEYRYIKNDIIERMKQSYVERNGEAVKRSERSIYGFVVNQMNTVEKYDTETGEIYWAGQAQLDYVRRIFSYKDYFFNYQAREYDGMLYKASIYPAGSKNAKIQIKEGLPVEKYGGYNEYQTACGLIVKGLKKVRNKLKEENAVITLPVMYANANEEDLIAYIKESEGFEEVLEIGKKIMLGQTFMFDNCLFTMSSPSEWQIRQPIFISEKNKKALYSASHPYVKVSNEELANAFIELLGKVYSYVPKLTSKVSKIIAQLSGRSEKELKSMELFVKTQEFDEILVAVKDSLMNLSDKELRLAINELMMNLSSKNCDLHIGTLKSPRFARLSHQNMKPDSITFVFTSPSGIYSKKVKGEEY